MWTSTWGALTEFVATLPSKAVITLCGSLFCLVWTTLIHSCWVYLPRIVTNYRNSRIGPPGLYSGPRDSTHRHPYWDLSIGYQLTRKVSLRYYSMFLKEFMDLHLLNEFLVPYSLRRPNLHSGDDKLLLHNPRTSRRYGDISFHADAPRLWNTLSLVIRKSPSSVMTFRKCLKSQTYLFPLA